ncbi:unnamed protein product [Mytilus coruscus]|uniref:CCHC-type domain-containing protein n=1 Tax=Mytilus coruscus TaxID=42192 RepID=A0A6J8AJP5_MYTCO|nr:unnamed protein product [Mytilus coruscus]
MKQEMVQKSQEHEESFYQLKSEREMLMNEIEEQARIIDSVEKKIKSKPKELEFKDQQYATKVQKLEDEYKAKTFSKLVETTGNLAPDNIYKSKMIPKIDENKTAVKIEENQSSMSTVVLIKKEALLAMEKNPTRMDQALQFVKSSIHNQRVLLGYKNSDIRRVQFEKYDQNDSDGDSELARVLKTEQDITEINNNVGKILKILESRSNDNRRPRSPSPNRSPARTVTCYSCNQEGHYSNQCGNKSNTSSPMRRNRSPSPINSRPNVHLNEQGSKK